MSRWSMFPPWDKKKIIIKKAIVAFYLTVLFPLRILSLAYILQILTFSLQLWV